MLLSWLHSEDMHGSPERWTLNFKRARITERLAGGGRAEYQVEVSPTDGRWIVSAVTIRRAAGVTGRNCRVSPAEALEEFQRRIANLPLAHLGDLVDAGFKSLDRQHVGFDRGMQLAFGSNARPLDRMARNARLATVAAEYVQACARHSRRPNEDVAAKVGKPASRIRDDLLAARRAGLLTETVQGSPGGRLTDKALAILESLTSEPSKEGKR